MRHFALGILLAGCVVRNTESPLTDAVRKGDVARVRELVARGADVNVTSGRNGWSPLIHAVHKNQLGTAAALIEGGADVNGRGASPVTPLMMAAAYDEEEMTALLLAHGANPKLQEPGGNTALDLAITGVRDIDRFTWFRCNESTAAMLRGISPPPRKSTMRWARLKGCA